jgi:hypothetical protein
MRWPWPVARTGLLPQEPVQYRCASCIATARLHRKNRYAGSVDIVVPHHRVVCEKPDCRNRLELADRGAGPVARPILAGTSPPSNGLLCRTTSPTRRPRLPAATPGRAGRASRGRHRRNRCKTGGRDIIATASLRLGDRRGNERAGRCWPLLDGAPSGASLFLLGILRTGPSGRSRRDGCTHCEAALIRATIPARTTWGRRSQAPMTAVSSGSA